MGADRDGVLTDAIGEDESLFGSRGSGADPLGVIDAFTEQSHSAARVASINGRRRYGARSPRSHK